MTIRAILFDIDGTLIDSNDFHVAAWQEVFERFGHPFDAQTIHDQVGKGGDNLVPTLLPDVPREKQEEIAAAHGPIFKERYIDRTRPFPGARDLLAAAKADGLKVVLASSAKGEELEHHLDTLDARGIVDETTSADDVESSKPDPDIFRAALAKAGVGPDEALVVGDTPYDIDAARKCGVRTLAVLSGGFPGDVLRDAGAAAVFDDVAAILREREEAGRGFWERFVSEAV